MPSKSARSRIQTSRKRRPKLLCEHEILEESMESVIGVGWPLPPLEPEDHWCRFGFRCKLNCTKCFAGIAGCLNSALLGLFSTSCSPSFSGHGYTTRRPANTSCPRSDRFRLLELRVFSTNLNILRSIGSDHGHPAAGATSTMAPDDSTGQDVYAALRRAGKRR